jgi:condensin complex subunit 1
VLFCPNMCLAKNGETESKADGNKDGDDLEMIGGTSEDDFSEAIALVRYFTHSPEAANLLSEKELLFGTQSLLARYGPLLVEVCSKPDTYKVNSLTAH